tara:strand:- start:92 stop:301 length:210 start_codon:yes stop_codon:yes gene_type:complete
MKKEKTYYTIAVRYTTEMGDPCEAPPHIMERIMTAMSSLHTIGYGMDVLYGQVTDKTFTKLVKEIEKDE